MDLENANYIDGNASGLLPLRRLGYYQYITRNMNPVLILIPTEPNLHCAEKVRTCEFFPHLHSTVFSD